jgi:hypothetical protein
MADTRTVLHVAEDSGEYDWSLINWFRLAFEAIGIDPDMPFDQFEVVTPEIRAVLAVAVEARQTTTIETYNDAIARLGSAVDAYLDAIKGDD